MNRKKRRQWMRRGYKKVDEPMICTLGMLRQTITEMNAANLPSLKAFDFFPDSAIVKEILRHPVKGALLEIEER